MERAARLCEAMISLQSCFARHTLGIRTITCLLAAVSLALTAAVAQPADAAAGPARGPLNPELPTLFVVGDSTASNGARGGWGDPLADYFDLSRINVANRARGARSSRSFQLEGHWENVLKEMKPGDTVLIQWGQNDGRTPAERPDRASLPGIGEETQEVTLSDGRTDTVHTYGWYLRKYISDTRAKGATPIILSLTAKHLWLEDGKNRRPYDNYPQWAREVAAAENVQFLDHQNIVGDQYDAMGRDRVAPLFRDSTHTTELGADLNAAAIVAGLKQLESPVVAYLSEKGREVRPYRRIAPEPAR